MFSAKANVGGVLDLTGLEVTIYVYMIKEVIIKIDLEI